MYSLKLQIEKVLKWKENTSLTLNNPHTFLAFQKRAIGRPQPWQYLQFQTYM
jgi:hypothetical protein